MARATDYQIRWVWFRDRDKDGSLIREEVDDEGKPLKVREGTLAIKSLFWETWRGRGWTETMIQARWDAEEQQRAEYRKKMGQSNG